MQVVGKIERDVQLTLCPAHQVSVGRDRQRQFRQADLEHDQERQQEQQRQPQQRHRDHQLAAMGHLQALEKGF
ncbi:hypothetical protein D3C80_2025730 [compost metagenome]